MVCIDIYSDHQIAIIHGQTISSAKPWLCKAVAFKKMSVSGFSNGGYLKYSSVEKFPDAIE